MIEKGNEEALAGQKTGRGPFEDAVEQRYSGKNGKNYHRAKHVVPDEVYRWVARLRAEKIGPFVTPEDTVLEYGVGNGWNLAGLHCHERLGFDLSEHLESTVMNHGICFVKDPATVADASVDVVLCHHVLEHTTSPTQVLHEIRRMLRPGGRFLLFVPYEKGKRCQRYEGQEPDHHLYSWNVQTLGNLVADMGFHVSVAGIGRFGYDQFAGVLAARLHLGEWGFRFMRHAMHLLLPKLEVRIVAERPQQ